MRLYYTHVVGSEKVINQDGTSEEENAQFTNSLHFSRIPRGHKVDWNVYTQKQKKYANNQELAKKLTFFSEYIFSSSKDNINELTSPSESSMYTVVDSHVDSSYSVYG